MTQVAHGELKEIQIEAVVIRADGTKENHGVVSYYHKNPLKRLKYHLLKRLSNGNSIR